MDTCKSLGNKKALRASSKIIPTGYGKSLNGRNKVFRNLILDKMVSEAMKNKMIIFDLDLVSCYLSILIGLFSKKLYYINAALKTGRIWKFIENEFKNIGKSEVYHKSFVKIYFYASLFGGGSKAMIGGILENEGKLYGMTEKEF